MVTYIEHSLVAIGMSRMMGLTHVWCAVKNYSSLVHCFIYFCVTFCALNRSDTKFDSGSGK